MASVICYAPLVVLTGAPDGSLTIVGGAPAGRRAPLDQLVASALRGVWAATTPAGEEPARMPRSPTERSPQPAPPPPTPGARPRLPAGPDAAQCRADLRDMIEEPDDLPLADKTLDHLDALHRAEREQAIADVWRRVGRYLLGSGLSGERDWGPLAWRRLYLTEVAPWADYAEGDEYRFLGMPAPER